MYNSSLNQKKCKNNIISIIVKNFIIIKPIQNILLIYQLFSLELLIHFLRTLLMNVTKTLILSQSYNNFTSFSKKIQL